MKRTTLALVFLLMSLSCKGTSKDRYTAPLPAPETKAKKVVEVDEKQKAAAYEVIHAARSRFDACFKEGLKKSPRLKGMAFIHSTFDAKGKVLSTKTTRTTLNNKKVEGCLMGVVKDLTFNEFSGDHALSVTYPFILDASGKMSTNPSAQMPKQLAPLIKPKTGDGTWLGDNTGLGTLEGSGKKMTKGDKSQ